ncbi:hypothetical protein KBC04_00560 [Candidatus Babeliales bacterium]|nr:hypothetical protein [Candidatus Babeliales bacterium]MBP9843417.1 hypothetical protein [Candidatus Babeliales bacterium]
MKKHIILLTCLSLLGSLFLFSKALVEYEEPMALCVGNIVFHTEIDPDLCLYYKGNKLQLDTNYDKKSKKIGKPQSMQQLVSIVPYSLNEVKATQDFHILICCRPEFASDQNTINYLYVPEKTAYKFYRLSAARKCNTDNEVEGCLWTATEEFLFDDRIVPDNTIIFLFNADFIEGLEVKSWPLHSNIRLLPNIVLKKTIEKQDVLRAIIEARLAAIDFDAVHAHHIQSSTKRESKTVVMIQP